LRAMDVSASMHKEKLVMSDAFSPVVSIFAVVMSTRHSAGRPAHACMAARTASSEATCMSSRMLDSVTTVFFPLLCIRAMVTCSLKSEMHFLASAFAFRHCRRPFVSTSKPLKPPTARTRAAAMQVAT